MAGLSPVSIEKSTQCMPSTSPGRRAQSPHQLTSALMRQAARLRDWLADVLVLAYDRKMTAARSVYVRQQCAHHSPQIVFKNHILHESCASQKLILVFLSGTVLLFLGSCV